MSGYGFPTAADLERIADRRQKVVSLTREGCSATEIAAIVGVTERTVRRDRTATGCTRQLAWQPMTVEEKQLALRLLDDGCSASEVARTVGRSPYTILRRFRGRCWTRAQCNDYLATLQNARKRGIPLC